MARVQQLRERFPAKLKILVVGRMVANKRLEISLEIAGRLKDRNVSFAMLSWEPGRWKKW